MYIVQHCFQQEKSGDYQIKEHANTPIKYFYPLQRMPLPGSQLVKNATIEKLQMFQMKVLILLPKKNPPHLFISSAILALYRKL